MPEIWETEPPLSEVVAQQGVADQAGAMAYSGVSDSSTAGEIAFGGPTADFIHYGVVNGAFAQGPPDSTQNIEPINNPLWYWYGPVQVSGGAITATHVDDASSPSGKNLRLTINPGAASDEAYFEQKVPVSGVRLRQLAHYVRATGLRVSASGGVPMVVASLQYLTASEATTGGSIEATATLSSDGALNSPALYTTSAAPADAAYIRLRVGVRRNTMAATDTAVIDITDVRMDRGVGAILLGDANLGAGNPTLIINSAERVFFRTVDESSSWVSFDPNASGGRSIYLGSGSTSADTRIYRVGAGIMGIGSTLSLPEQAAPATPASGNYYIYPKTDGILYGLNDAGTETELGGGGSDWDATITQGSDQNKTNTTLTASTDLTVTLSAGLYMMEIVIKYSNAAGGAPDLQLDMGEDTTGRSVIMAVGRNDTETATVVGQVCRTGLPTAWGTSTAERTVYFRGPYNSNGGTFTVYFAQNTVNATATKLLAGSFLRYKAL